MSTEERTGDKRLLSALLTGPARFVCEKVIAPMRRRARGRTGARGLAQLDDRLLRDIGLTRSQVHAAAYGLLRLREPSPAGAGRASPPPEPANVVRLKRRALAVRVDEATSAPLAKRAARR